MSRPSLFTKIMNRKQAQQSSLGPVEQGKSQEKHVDALTNQRFCAHAHNQISTNGGTSHLHQDADNSPRIPQGTQVIELREPMALARLVEQKMRKKGAKTERWRLSLGNLRGVDKGQEKHEKDSPYVVPNGTMAVALKEPVPLASLSEVMVKSGKHRLKRGVKEERVRVMVRSGG